MAKATSAMQDIPKRLQQAGFEVREIQPGRLEVKKSGCVAYLEKQGAAWTYPGPPYFVVHGINCELEDRGYQKFWYAKSDGRRFPIRKVDLLVLHRFDEEIRYHLQIKSLYHESL